MRKKYIIICLLSLISAVIILATNCAAQKIICEIRINLDKLPSESQPKLRRLSDEVDNYINNYEWTEDEFQYDMTCEMEIAFSKAMSTSYEDRYEASFVISNGVDLHYADKRWVFALNEGESPTHSSVFHPMTAMLDFYIYLILAHDYDKLKKFGGDQYYDQALAVSESAKFATQYYFGWDRREELLKQLVSPSSKPYRELIWHYYTGYYFYESGETDAAKEHLLAAVNILPRVNEDKLKRFYDLNYINFTEALEKLGEKEAAAKLPQYKNE
ncbi:DUF4835 family protein [bacterium]|nr:DUF4835 family protein [bacterium]